MFSSIPGLYQLVTHWIQLCQPSTSPDTDKCPLGDKNHPKLRTTDEKGASQRRKEKQTPRLTVMGIKKEKGKRKQRYHLAFWVGVGKGLICHRSYLVALEICSR